MRVEVLFFEVVRAVWLMLPAYIANSSAAFFGSFLGRTPIDLNHSFRGNRILGDGKTYEGFFCGVAAGFLIGLIQQHATGTLTMPNPTFSHSTFTSTSTFTPESPTLTTFQTFPKFTTSALLCLTVGALLGDIAASFIKRRLNLKRGTPLPLVDQLDFVAGAFLFLFMFARDWFLSCFSTLTIIIVIIITPVLHLLTNYIGFVLKIKKEPW